MNIYNEMEKMYPSQGGVKQHPVSESISYLTVYWVNDCYGGHEEGGWWYNDYFHIYSEPINPCLITMDQLEIRLEELKEKFSQRYVGNSDAKGIEVCFETVKRSYSNRSRPYYS